MINYFDLLDLNHVYPVILSDDFPMVNYYRLRSAPLEGAKTMTQIEISNDKNIVLWDLIKGMEWLVEWLSNWSWNAFPDTGWGKRHREEKGAEVCAPVYWARMWSPLRVPSWIWTMKSHHWKLDCTEISFFRQDRHDVQDIKKIRELC